MKRSARALGLLSALVLCASVVEAQGASISDGSLIEGDSGTMQMVFTISLDGDPGGGTVTYETADVSAFAGSDYDAVGPVVLGGLTGSDDIFIPIHGDMIVEGDQTFSVILSNATGGITILAGEGVGTGTIIDDDTTELSIGDAMVTEGQEGGTIDAVFTVSLTKESETLVFVDFDTSDGTAMVGDGDYEAKSMTVTFMPGDFTQMVSVTVNGDDKFEQDEGFQVTLSNPVGATDPIVSNSAVGTIKNDDVEPTVSIGDVVVTEGDGGTTVDAVFTVSLTNPSATTVEAAFATRDGAATTGDSDYVMTTGGVTFDPGVVSQTVTVTVNGDGTVEPDEEFFVDLSDVAGAMEGDLEGMGTITNDDGTMLSIDDVSLLESDSGTANAVFSISLSAPSATAVTVRAGTRDGSATAADNDYQARARIVTIDPGQTSASFQVAVNGDRGVEPDETFFVDLSNPDGAAIADSEGQGTIRNDDQGVLSISDASVAEGDSGTADMVFIVSLSPASATAVSVDFATRNGSATTADGDYRSTSDSLRFPAGTSTQTLVIPVNGDSDIEPDEVFFVDLSNPTGASVADGEGRGTITNDDEDSEPGEVRLVAIGDVAEGAGSATVQVERVGNAAGAASVRARAQAGTAAAGDDFTAVSQVLNWADGELGGKSFEVVILDDNLQEGDETVRLRLTNPSGATLGTPSDLELTIVDDDAAMVLEVVGEPEVSGDVGAEIELQVRASREDGAPVAGATVDWQVEGNAEVVESTATVTDGEGITGLAFRLGDTPGSAEISAELVGTDASVLFEITIEGDLDDLFDPSADPGEASVADTLNNACREATGAFADACDYLFGLEGDEQRAAIAAITPRQGGTAGSLSVESPQVQLENLWLRLAALRGGVTRRSVDQLAFNIRGRGIAVGQLATAISGYELAEETVAEWIERALDKAQGEEEGSAAEPEPAADDGESRLGFFVSGRVSIADEPRSDREEGADIQTLGITAGLDYRLTSQFILGGALGYLDTQSELDGDGGNMDARGYSLSVYGTYFGERYYLDGVASYGRHEYDALRNIDLPVPFEGRTRFGARGSPDGSQLSLGFGGGYDKVLGAATLTGLARVSYIDATVDGYSETGAAPFNLDIRGQDVESLLLEGGVEVAWAASYSWGVLQPQLRLSHLHEFEDDSRMIRGRFQEDSSGGEFAIPTDPPDRAFMNVGVGVTATLTRGRALYLFYETDLERDDLDLYTISAGFRWSL